MRKRKLTERMTAEQAKRFAVSLREDVEFEDWLKHSPPMGSLRNTAGLIGECVEDLSIAVKRRDWSLVEKAASRLQGEANTLSILADAKKDVKPKGKSLIDVFTVKRSVLVRMAAINSRDLPHLIDDGGRRKRWFGIGWVDEGPADGTEVLVVD